MSGAEERMTMSRLLVSTGDQQQRPLGQHRTSAVSTDWLSISSHPSMGNLAPALRRSMPSVNAAAPTSSAGGGGVPRHGSFSIEEERREEHEDHHQRLLLAAGEHSKKVGAPTTTMGGGGGKTIQVRCASAHSSASLSPSGSMHNFSEQHNNNITSRSVEAAGTAATVLDARQIQVFLKKREDSVGTVTTTDLLMSDADSLASASVRVTANPAGAAISHQQHPPTLPHQSSSVSGTTTTVSAQQRSALAHSRKLFRSSDTRSSIFSSVSSSVDSAKEERIIANLEHINPLTQQCVMVLPRPSAAASVRVDSAEEAAAAADGGTQRTWNQGSSECRTPMPPPASGGGAEPPARIPSLALSAWHSISDLTPSARMASTAGALGAARRVSAVGAGSGTEAARGSTAAAGGQVPSAELWLSPPAPRPQSQASSHRRSNYLGELVWQVDEMVFCGGIEAVQNQNLLCRLNIEYIVDLSGQEDDPTLSNNRPRTECPCLCPRRTAHSRMTMSIRIKDESRLQLAQQRDVRPETVDAKLQLLEREEIVRYFETLIDLIRKARISQKKVLIHSLKGRNRAPAFVAAYLMHTNRMTRVQAIKKITKLMSSMRPGLCISDNLQRALMRWQSILGIRSESTRLDSQSLNKMFCVKRTAWN